MKSNIPFFFFNKRSFLKIFGTAAIMLSLFSCQNEAEELDSDFENFSSNELSQNSVELSYNSITASTEQSTNPISNIDDSGSEYLNTRWSGYGTSANVYVDFGSEVTVDYLNIAFHDGDTRNAYFSYWYSDDGSSWTWKGSKTSSGDTESHETFDLSNITARYLRIKFQGNSTNEWNSVLDLEIYGTPGDSNSSNSDYTSIPATIQAEDYDSQSGIQTESTSDSGGGENVGYINNGDYMTYNVNVPSSDTYTINFRVASRSSGTEFDIYQGNSVVGSISSNATGGWQTWETVSTSVNLSSGNQTIKIQSTGGAWNINWLQFTEEQTSSTPITTTPGPTGTGGTVEDILGDFWKITVPVDEDGNGSPTNCSEYDCRNNDAVDLYGLNEVAANNDYSDYFYEDNGWVVFTAFCGGATTENSQYPRSELRGLDSGGDDSYFDMDDYQELEVTVKVLDVPVERPEVNMVQIHGPDEEPLRVEFNDGSTGSDQGLHLTVNENDDSHNDVMDYSIGQELKVHVIVDDGHLWLELDNLSTGGHYETDYDVSDDTGYWKVGCYLQGSITYCDVKSSTSFCQNGGESDDYNTTGSVAVKDLSLIRDGQTYK